MAIFQNGMGLTIIDPRTVDERYAAATTDAEKQRIVAERDATNARIAAENDAWHKSRGTGPYAGSGGGGGAAAPAMYDRSPAREMLMSIFRDYGMEDLASAVDSFIVDNGANDTYTLAERVRSSNQYKDRFKGLIALRARGVTDIQNEGEYLRTESAYREKFREAGLQSFLGTSGSQAERNAIADLVGKYSVSVNEVGDRIADAQRVIADTPQEVRDSLQRYYNVDPTTLVSYVLDPARNAQQINRLANAAVIGGYGQRAGLDITAQGAAGYADLLGAADISTEQLQTDVAAARTLRDEAKRLAQIEQTDLTDTEAFQAQLKTDATATEKITGLRSRERARFGGSSGIGKGALTRPNTF
jgi:hypothetical protein